LASWSKTDLRWDSTLNRCFFREYKTLMSMPRVWVPVSETDPKLTFRAMTVGLRSRSARLLSAGTFRS
jgi:hypothetical protein